MTRPQLVIMAKLPKAGSVKTRLGREIGAVRATYFYRYMVACLLQRLGRDPRWETCLAVTPDEAVSAPLWPGYVRKIKQGRGDLGVRMQSLFDDGSCGPRIIIGTDIPHITPQIIAGAFQRLAGCDVVIGPSDDGGYWLVGQNRIPRPLDMFAAVRWSSPHARADTLANLRGRKVQQLQRLVDVDSAADYRALKAVAARVILPFR